MRPIATDRPYQAEKKNDAVELSWPQITSAATEVEPTSRNIFLSIQHSFVNNKHAESRRRLYENSYRQIHGTIAMRRLGEHHDTGHSCLTAVLLPPGGITWAGRLHLFTNAEVWAPLLSVKTGIH